MRERASRRPSPSSGSGCRPARRRGSRRTGRGRRCRPAPAQWSRRSPEASDRHRSNEIRAGHVDTVSGRHDAARPLRPRPSPARGRAAIQGRVPPPRGLPRRTGRRRPARPARGPALPRAGSSSGRTTASAPSARRRRRPASFSARARIRGRGFAARAPSTRRPASNASAIASSAPPGPPPARSIGTNTRRRAHTSSGLSRGSGGTVEPATSRVGSPRPASPRSRNRRGHRRKRNRTRHACARCDVEVRPGATATRTRSGTRSAAKRSSTEARPARAMRGSSAAWRSSEGCRGGTSAIRRRVFSTSLGALATRTPSTASGSAPTTQRTRSRRAGRAASVSSSTEPPQRGSSGCEATAAGPCETRSAGTDAVDRWGRPAASTAGAAPGGPRPTPRLGRARDANALFRAHRRRRRIERGKARSITDRAERDGVGAAVVRRRLLSAVAVPTSSFRSSTIARRRGGWNDGRAGRGASPWRAVRSAATELWTPPRHGRVRRARDATLGLRDVRPAPAPATRGAVRRPAYRTGAPGTDRAELPPRSGPGPPRSAPARAECGATPPPRPRADFERSGEARSSRNFEHRGRTKTRMCLGTLVAKIFLVERNGTDRERRGFDPAFLVGVPDRDDGDRPAIAVGFAGPRHGRSVQPKHDVENDALCPRFRPSPRAPNPMPGEEGRDPTRRLRCGQAPRGDPSAPGRCPLPSRVPRTGRSRPPAVRTSLLFRLARR